MFNEIRATFCNKTVGFYGRKGWSWNMARLLEHWPQGTPVCWLTFIVCINVTAFPLLPCQCLCNYVCSLLNSIFTCIWFYETICVSDSLSNLSSHMYVLWPSCLVKFSSCFCLPLSQFPSISLPIFTYSCNSPPYPRSKSVCCCCQCDRNCLENGRT
jgi:hypothetical protein